MGKDSTDFFVLILYQESTKGMSVSGNPRGATGVLCTMLVVVWPKTRNWSSTSSSWSSSGR